MQMSYTVHGVITCEQIRCLKNLTFTKSIYRVISNRINSMIYMGGRTNIVDSLTRLRDNLRTAQNQNVPVKVGLKLGSVTISGTPQAAAHLSM